MLLGQIYLFCAGAGFIYIVGTAGLGMLNAQQGDSSGGADGGGDGSSIDSGDGGGDGSSIDGGDGGGGDGSSIDGDFGTGDARHAASMVGRANVAHLRTSTERRRKPSLGLLFIKLTSPSTIAMFAFFFGLSGLILEKYLAILGPFTFLPATVFGVLGYNGMCSLTNYIADKMHASTLFSDDQLIGTVAEITVPIPAGKMGEIIYLSGKVRGTASAKGADGEDSFAKSSKVTITDVRDGVFIVEPCRDFVEET